MRTAQTVLTVIQERGKQHKPIERVYKLLFNRDFYLNAYAKLYPNNGAMTKGVTDETVDGMSIQKIDRMIELLREEKYQWKPARREYIPKKNGKKRPLGIPTWGDKLLQEVMREILEAYYEPQFSNHSHGFRPNRGCHTALQEIQIWKGTRWFIEGDISKYFDTIDHDVLLKILEKNIHDGRFLRLISNMLKAGYLDDWKFNQTISGTPQGGVISPLLANIYLNEFDQWIENTLIPQYTKGKRQKSNPVYNRMNAEISKARKNGDMQTAHKLEVERRNIPSVDPYDENYRRCRYVRYADDFLIGFTGSKADAEEIKAAMHNFLENELHLELSQEKTLITNASSQAAKFLGYEIKAQRANDYIDPKGRRGANGAIALFVPAKVIESKCQSFKRKGKVTHRNELLQEDDFSIVQQFQAEYRGLIQYYILAQNLSWFSTLYWVMEALLGLLGMAMNRTEPVSIGRYKGFDLQIAYFAMDKMYLAYLVGSGINPVQLGADAIGNTVRLDNCLHNLPQSVTDLESKLVQLQKQLENAKEQLAQPFAQADELAEKSKRLAELEALLNLNEKDIVLDTVPDEEQQCRSDNRQRGQER